MPKKVESHTSEAMKEQEDALYESYRVATRALLIKHKAEDLIPMLGLEEESHEHDPS